MNYMLKDKVCRIHEVKFEDEDILSSLKRYNISSDDSLVQRGILAQAKFDIATIWPLHKDSIPLDTYIDLIMEKYPHERWLY